MLSICYSGDGAVGKTCMLISYTTDKFPEDYVPTIFDNYTADLAVDGRSYILNLYDTTGQEDYDMLRPLSYQQTDLFIVVFALNSKESYENVKSKWIPEIEQHAPGVPFIIVGTKADLRESSHVSKQQGQQLKIDTKACAYLECSARTREGLKDVFDTAIQAILDARPKPAVKAACCIVS